MMEGMLEAAEKCVCGGVEESERGKKIQLRFWKLSRKGIKKLLSKIHNASQDVATSLL